MYGNCKVLSNDGELLFRAATKKINWYLNKGLAHRIDEDTIQLNFEHAGRSNAGDVFALSEKINQCVVCGSPDNLTRHHVVPYWYRKNFPSRYKQHSSHDVLLVCRECHSWYELRFANELKAQIASEYDVPFISTEFLSKLRQQMIAKAIINHGNKMPQSRREDLLIKLAIELGDFPEDHEVKGLASADFDKQAKYCHGEHVVQKITDLQEFVIRWRKHFVETMRPRFLPEGWDINRSLEMDATKMDRKD